MKVSVCIFTFNHEQFIEQAIESVLMQNTSFDFEIVIGEDCSTDGTRQIVASYQQRYPDKIRAFMNDRNLGVMPNNVYTLSKCEGQYIALLDGDDYWLSVDKLQRQVDFLDSQRNYVLCFHDARILDPDGQFQITTCCGASQKQIVFLTDIICDTHIPTGSVVFRRDALSGFPPDNYCTLKATDRPLFLWLSKNGPCYYLNECWSVYRKHPNGDWTGRSYQNRWLTHLQIHRFMDDHYNKTYHTYFCKCTSRITFQLALDLIRDGRLKRGKCYMRKLLRIACSRPMPSKAQLYIQVLFLLLLYIKGKVLPG